MSVKVTSKGDKKYKALLARIAGAKNGAHVTVGVHEAEGNEASKGDAAMTVLDVAVINEFGSEDGKHPPPRSFIGAWADQNKDQNEATMRAIGSAVVNGKVKSLKVGLDRAGLRFRGDIQKRIKAGIAPPNAASTIERKGSSTPLIDTGQLWTSISHQVHEGSKE